LQERTVGHAPQARTTGTWKEWLPPVVLDFWSAEFGSLWAADRVRARVVRRQQETADCVTLWLQPNRRFTGFAPGQHLNLTVEVDGRRLSRSYSPSSAPRADGRVAITVQCIPGGKVSEQLCRRTRVGDVLELGKAFGAMTPTAAGTAPLLLLAAGSGITPLASLVRSAAARGFSREITLLYWARTAADFCFAAELAALAQREPRFHLQLLSTRETALLTPGGRISAALLQNLVPDLEQRQVYACGPAGFVQAAQALTAARAHGFVGESFSVAAAPAALPADARVRVELAASGRTLELAAGESLLVALEAAGFNPAHGCRMGVCNTCSCLKLEGSTQDLRSGVLHHEPDSRVQLCISRPAGDLRLDL